MHDVQSDVCLSRGEDVATTKSQAEWMAARRLSQTKTRVSDIYQLLRTKRHNHANLIEGLLGINYMVNGTLKAIRDNWT